MTDPREPLRRLMTVREVAGYCRVSAETVRRWIRAQKLLPAGQVPGGRYLFDLVAVDTFLGIAPAPAESGRESTRRASALPPSPVLPSSVITGIEA